MFSQILIGCGETVELVCVCVRMVAWIKIRCRTFHNSTCPIAQACRFSGANSWVLVVNETTGIVQVYIMYYILYNNRLICVYKCVYIYIYIFLFFSYLFSFIYIYDRFHLSLGRHDAIKSTRAEFVT